MALRFKYMSWNMKNLSSNSMKREYVDYLTMKKTFNLTGYTLLITATSGTGADMLGIIEVTKRTGPAAIIALIGSLNTKSGVNWRGRTTTALTHGTRYGENNGMVYKQVIGSNHVFVDPTINFPSGKFQNRVPVLFPVLFGKNLAPNNSIIVDGTCQIVTWHAPAPGDINPSKEIPAFMDGLEAMVTANHIDASKPLVIAGDFNFNTDPSVQKAWNGIYGYSNHGWSFKGLGNGKKTTLVVKDPAQRATPITPTSYEDLLASSYDNVIIEEGHITVHSQTPVGMKESTVVNHLAELVAQTRSTFTHDATRTALEIKAANKISDHLAVLVDLETK